MSSGEVNKRTVYSVEQKITKLGFESCSTKMIPPHSVVVALAGQGKTRGMVARTRIELCTNQSLCAIVPQAGLNSDFLYHYLSSQYSQLRSVSAGDGGRGGLNLQLIRSYLLPLPPLQIQEEIVSILDKLDALVNDITIGLPAEIAARRKQYEYYRNKLLTFKELDAA
jgi:type I restriction enzyme S subunit